MKLDSEMYKQITEINQFLEKEHLCLPIHSRMNMTFFNDLLNRIRKENEISEILPLIEEFIISPYDRAYQTVYKYRELEIFKPFYKVIDFATLSFYRGNYTCSYVTLVPVIEGIIKEWENLNPLLENGSKPYACPKCKHTWGKERCSPQKYIKEQKELFETTLEKDNYYHNWIYTLWEYLAKLLGTVFYEHHKPFKKKSENGENFNRAIASHMLEKPESFCKRINVIRLFLLIDVIAELYFRKNKKKYSKLNSASTLEFKERLRFPYEKIYTECSAPSNIASYETLLNNIHVSQ